MNKKVKLHECEICFGSYTKRNSFQKCCSPKCAIEYQRRHEYYAALGLNKKTGKQKKNDLPREIHLAQKAFNRFIRLRDKGRRCISCESILLENYDAGHFRSVGSSPALRFHEDNCHGQCQKCNRFLSGNLAYYRKELFFRIGEIRLLELELANPIREVKYYASDYESIKENYLGKCAEEIIKDNS